MNTTSSNRKRTTPLQRYGLPYSRGLQPPRRTERAGGSIILRGILLANLAVRCIVNLPFRLLGISPDGAGRNGELPAPNKYRTAGGHSPSPIPQLQYHSSPSPAVRHSQRAIRSDRWADALIYCVDRIGFALPYIIGGCIIGLLISNLWKVL